MSPVRIESDMHKSEMMQDIVTPQEIPDVVPACPPGLAFQKQDFLPSDFTVDGFLSRTMTSGNDVGLERLRDDLGIYLKVRYRLFQRIVLSPPQKYFFTSGYI